MPFVPCRDRVASPAANPPSGSRVCSVYVKVLTRCGLTTVSGLDAARTARHDGCPIAGDEVTEREHQGTKRTRRRRRGEGSAELGLRIRKARMRRDLSQEALAHLVGRSPGWMLQVENGSADPLHSDLVNIADVLDVDLSALVADKKDDQNAGPQPLPATPTRRPATDVLLDVERLHHARRRPGSVDGDLLDQLATLIGSHWQSYHTTDPTLLLPVVATQVAQLRPLADESMAPGTAHRLRVLTADAASLAGWLALRLEERATASIYWALAESLAADARDQVLRSFALVSRSSLYSSTLRGDLSGDNGLALAYVTAGAEAASDAGAVQVAWMLARRAEEHAVRGDTRAAHRDLGDAAECLGRAQGTPGGYFAAWDQAQLDGYRGSCATALGSPEAVAILEGSLASTDTSLISQRTAILANLGAAHARLGHVDAACEALVEAVTVAGRSSLAVAIRRARGVRARLDPWAAAPAVRHLDELIASLP